MTATRSTATAVRRADAAHPTKRGTGGFLQRKNVTRWTVRPPAPVATIFSVCRPRSRPRARTRRVNVAWTHSSPALSTPATGVAGDRLVVGVAAVERTPAVDARRGRREGAG